MSRTITYNNHHVSMTEAAIGPWWSSGQDFSLSLPRPGFDSQAGILT